MSSMVAAMNDGDGDWDDDKTLSGLLTEEW